MPVSVAPKVAAEISAAMTEAGASAIATMPEACIQ